MPEPKRPPEVALFVVEAPKRPVDGLFAVLAPKRLDVPVDCCCCWLGWFRGAPKRPVPLVDCDCCALFWFCDAPNRPPPVFACVFAVVLPNRFEVCCGCVVVVLTLLKRPPAGAGGCEVWFCCPLLPISVSSFSRLG